ncbi:MAG: DUF1398 domain-containing protein [Flavobacterium sp.]
MFTLNQIQEIHSKVKSGADFPNYVQELEAIGMSHYNAFVEDGHTEYYGTGGQTLTSPAKYERLTIADTADKDRFEEQLKLHQQGGTDYPAFCRDCAETGVEKWCVDMNKMTCTYYDKAGNALLTEPIPEL